MNKRTLSLPTLCAYLLSACLGWLGFCPTALAQTNPLKTQAQNEFLQTGMVVLADFSNLDSAEQEKNALVTVESTDGATVSVSTDHLMSTDATSALKLDNLKKGSKISVKSKYNLDLLPTAYQVWMILGIKSNGDTTADKIPLLRYVDVGGYQTNQTDASVTLNDANNSHSIYEREFLNKPDNTDTQTLIDGLAAESNTTELKFCLEVRNHSNFTGGIDEIYVEKIYLKAPGYGQTLSTSIVTTSDASDVIYENLDGSNDYNFTFAEKLYAGDDAVEVYEVTSDGEVLTQQPYTVTINNEKLKVQFANTVTPYITYKIKLDKTKLIFANGKKLTDDITKEFYVSNTADIFNVVSHMPENGANLLEFPREVVIDFTNDVALGQEIADLICVYKDGTKLYNTYDFSVAGSNVILTFSNVFADGEYKIVVNKNILNDQEAVLPDDYEFTFKVASASSETDAIDVFKAGDDADMADASGISVESDPSLVNLYSVTGKCSYKADAQTTAKFYGETRSFDASDMAYLNLWLYSPKSTSDTVNVSCYTSFADSQYRLCQVPQNWLGWKLVSLPIADFNNSSYGSGFERVYVNIGGWNSRRDTDGYILIDRIWFSKEQPRDFSLEFISMADGYQNARIIGEQLVYTFSEEVDTSVVPEVVITGGSSVPVSSAVMHENRVTVTFGELTPGAEYTIQLKNVVSKDGMIYSATPLRGFTAASEGVYLNDVSFSGSDSVDATNTATFEFDVFGASSHSIQTVIYAMDDDNGYTGEIIESHDISVSSDSALVSYTCPADTTRLKAFALDCNGNVVSHKVITLNGSTKSSENFVSLGTSRYADIKLAQLNVNIVTLDISLGGIYGGGFLSIKSDDASHTACLDVVLSDFGGHADYVLRMPDTAESGIYNIILRTGSASESTSLYYLDKADRDFLLSLANDTNVSSLAGFVSTHYKAFEFTNISPQYAQDIAELIIAEDSFGGYTEVRDYIKSLKAQVDLINDGVWSDITSVIKNNPDFFDGSADEDYLYFTALSESAKNKVSVNMCSYVPASSITALNSAFEKAIEDYKDSIDDRGSSHKSSGGGSVLGGFIPSNPSVQVPPVNEPVFTDISGVAWAEAYIIYLYNKGVVSMPSDGKFRPNDSVTREEFVKMLVSAFYDDMPLSSCVFTDVADGAWYGGYLSKAYSAGLITGYPDGSFGVGRLITREEMATLCSRAVNALGTNLNGEYTLSFRDTAHISSYASEHVAALLQMNIINGYTDGTFVPQGNATRAEATKIIAMLMQRN